MVKHPCLEHDEEIERLNKLILDLQGNIVFLLKKVNKLQLEINELEEKLNHD